MKLKSIRLKNFRCFKDQTIEVGAYSALVGPNGVGKSVILSALNVFFNEPTSHIPVPAALGQDIFFSRDTSEPIVITLTFTNLSQREKDDLKEYVRADQLIVALEATFDPAKNFAEPKRYGIRRGVGKLRPFFEAWKAKAKLEELHACLEAVKESLPNFPELPKKKDDIHQTISAYDQSLTDMHEDIQSEDLFYGFTKGAHKLRGCLQYAYVPAVKDAVDEQQEGRNSALSVLVSRLVRTKVNFKENISTLVSEAQAKYKSMLAGHEATLEEASARLTELTKAFFPELESAKLTWSGSEAKNIQINEPNAAVLLADKFFSGPVSQFGHGVQRSYLIALLQMIAETANQETQPTLIIACEEPELYQHPPQARHLAHVLRELTKKDCQVIVTTHSPIFVSGETFEDIVKISRHGDASSAKSMTYANYAELVANIQGRKPYAELATLSALAQRFVPALSELYFSRFVVLVEGLEDAALLAAALEKKDLWIDFVAKGGNIIPVSGKSCMLCPAAICFGLNIPFICIFDRDAKPITDNQGDCLLKLCEATDEPVDGQVYWGERVIAWPKTFQTSVAEGFEAGVWERAFSATCQKVGAIEGSAGKNGYLLRLTLNQLKASGKWPEILDKTVDIVMAFANKMH